MKELKNVNLKKKFKTLMSINVLLGTVLCLFGFYVISTFVGYWCGPSLGPRKDNSEHSISLRIY